MEKIDRWNDGMLDIGLSDEQRPRYMQDFMVKAGVKHYCQLTAGGPLRLPADTELPRPAHGCPPIGAHVHLTDLQHPPPIIWNNPAVWSYDPRRFHHTDPNLRTHPTNPDDPGSVYQSFESGMCSSLLCTLFSCDTGLPTSMDPQSMLAMFGVSPTDLIGSRAGSEWFNLDMYASPYSRIVGHPLSITRASTGRFMEQGHRLYAQGMSHMMVQKMNKKDRSQWKAAVEAPKCKACDWEPLQAK